MSSIVNTINTITNINIILNTIISYTNTYKVGVVEDHLINILPNSTYEDITDALDELDTLGLIDVRWESGTDRCRLRYYPAGWGA